jgi:hypothetical protein
VSSPKPASVVLYLYTADHDTGPVLSHPHRSSQPVMPPQNGVSGPR